MVRYLLGVYSLLAREFKLFYRQRSRIIGVVLQPLVFWFVLGSGMNSSFNSGKIGEIGYLEYFFPGIILMVLLFTSIFSTISIIEDRDRGFLQGVLIAPIPRSSIVLGKVLGGTALGMVQGILFLGLLYTPLINLDFTLRGFILLLLPMFFLGATLSGIGTIMAWSMNSVHGYHAIMSVFLFPLWLFSGAVFPLEGTPMWIYWLMRANPLSHGLSLMRKCFYLGPSDPQFFTKSMIVSSSYLIACSVVVILLSTWIVKKRT